MSVVSQGIPLFLVISPDGFFQPGRILSSTHIPLDLREENSELFPIINALVTKIYFLNIGFFPDRRTGKNYLWTLHLVGKMTE